MADSYNKQKNQVLPVHGDQGKPMYPNSDSYSGNGGSGYKRYKNHKWINWSLCKKYKIWRHFINTVVWCIVNVTVDPMEMLHLLLWNKESPFADINAIALKRAKQIKFSKGSRKHKSGTIQIKFEIQRIKFIILLSNLF